MWLLGRVLEKGMKLTLDVRELGQVTLYVVVHIRCGFQARNA